MLKKLSIILITYLLCNQAALAAVVVGSIPNSLSKKASYLDGKNIYLKKGQQLLSTGRYIKTL